MKKKFSSKWSGSKQARKQRKYRRNAPLHVRQKLVSATLSKELRRQYKKRSLPLRKGDEVEVMRGKSRGAKGSIEKVDLSKIRVFVDSVKIKKTDGREVSASLDPSNLRITRLNIDDKRRQSAIQRGGKAQTAKEKPLPEKK